MPIKGISEARQLPRLGMVRLGIKAKTASGKEYPQATDYFVVPPEVAEKFGPKPQTLDVRLPLEGDNDGIFPTWLKLYGKSTGLKARSDGETITWLERDNDNKITEKVEPVKDMDQLEEAGFRPTGTLSFLLPKVSMAGVYQLVTGSFHTIRNINSGLDLIRGIFGRVAGLPLKLVMVPQDFNLMKDGKPFKKTAYVVQIRFDNQEIMQFIKQRKKFLSDMQEAPSFQLAAAKPVEAEVEAPADTEPAKELPAVVVEPETEPNDFDDTDFGGTQPKLI